MRVLFTTNYPSPYRVNFFNELGKFCDLTVLFEQQAKEQVHRDPDWFISDYHNFKAVFLNGYKLKKGHFSKVFCPSMLQEIKKNYDFRVICNYNTYSSIFSIFYMKVKHIPYWIETDGGFKKNKKSCIEVLKRFLLSGAVGYFSPGKFADEYLAYYGASLNKIYRYSFTSLYKDDIIKSPITEEEKNNIKKALNIPFKRIIISVGQIIHRKGFDILLASVKDIPNDVGVYIIGGTPSVEYLAKVKELGLSKQVHFISFKKKKELSKFYKMADIFILPTREDIWGLVINEAMAYGLPVITTNKCGAGLELVNSRNGVIVPAGNILALNRAIKNLLGLSKDQLNKMGQNSLERISSFTIENMAIRHKEVFDNNLK